MYMVRTHLIVSPHSDHLQQQYMFQRSSRLLANKMFEEAIIGTGTCIGKKHKASRKREIALRARRKPFPKGQKRNFEEHIRSFKGQECSFTGQEPPSSFFIKAPSSFMVRTLTPPDNH